MRIHTRLAKTPRINGRVMHLDRVHETGMDRTGIAPAKTDACVLVYGYEIACTDLHAVRRAANLTTGRLGR